VVERWRPTTGRVYRIGDRLLRLLYVRRGDTIAKITHATGVAQAVEAVSHATGVPCGCKERQEWLNEVVPYRQE
jgi:hypothetical protein